MNEDEHIDEDEIIDDVLGDNPRASQLRLMRAALEERRGALRKELERSQDDVERNRLQGKIKVLDKQIEALRQEEGVSEFVETSVRVVLSKSALDED